MNQSKWVLPIIVISQFCCTSLWFASNGVMIDLVSNFDLEESALGHLTSAVQFGFIIGTLVFALFTIADRFSPSKVFFICAIIGALFNLGTILEFNVLASLLSFRFLTGFFLAGIYPVGMKIAADYFEKGLGKSLGFLVGALVLGTAFPHLISGIGSELPWKMVLVITSCLATFGGLLMVLFVPNGPYRKTAQSLDISSLFKVFNDGDLKSAAFGYFGHMWELYAFWAFVPLMLSTYIYLHPESEFNIPILTFSIIGVGGIACVIGGYLSQSFGTKKVATIALILSCICCLISPLFFMINIEVIFLSFLFFWGMVVILDSPLFSTLVAQNSLPEFKGTAITIVNSIGFAITIVSIQLLTIMKDIISVEYIFTLLALGPIVGLIALKRKN